MSSWVYSVTAMKADLAGPISVFRWSVALQGKPKGRSTAQGNKWQAIFEQHNGS